MGVPSKLSKTPVSLSVLNINNLDYSATYTNQVSLMKQFRFKTLIVEGQLLLAVIFYFGRAVCRNQFKRQLWSLRLFQINIQGVSSKPTRTISQKNILICLNSLNKL